jgi:hypothetical protein
MNAELNLYDLVVNSDYKTLFNRLKGNESYSELEKATYCLAFSRLGKIDQYDNWLSRIDQSKSTGKVKSILLEAKLIVDLQSRTHVNDIEGDAQKIVEKDRSAIFARSTLGQAAFIALNFPKALQIFEEIHSEYPKANWIFRLITHHYLITNHFKKARENASKIGDPVMRLIFRALTIFIPLEFLFYAELTLLMIAFSSQTRQWVFYGSFLVFTSLFLYLSKKERDLQFVVGLPFFFVFILYIGIGFILG